jgi:hypothetical protein
MIRFINHHATLALTMMACIAAVTSCQDDEWQTADTTVEGLPATLNIPINVGEMDVKTRSIIDQDAANQCDNIWVGVYMESTGECVSNRVYVIDGYTEQIGTLYDLPNVTVMAESGEARIVAVANVDNEDATVQPTDGPKQVVTLRTALENATTWDAFKKITVHKDQNGEPAVRTGTLMMSGYYIGSDTLYTDADGVPVVKIQAGTNDLAGAIYLRRLTSYNKVNISAGPNITMQLKTWQVCNIPSDSYVFEHTTASASTGTSVNAGTLVPADLTPYANSVASHIFSLNQDVVAEGDDDSKWYSFEFYQYENKRTACAYSATSDDYVGIRTDNALTGRYYDREREYKNADGTNTGIYKSLVADRNGDLDNNNASYFVFTAELDYYIDDTPANRANPGLAEPVAYDATKKLIHRTAQSTYTVHCGYCEGKNDDGSPSLQTLQDFNCRRNTKYTYNIRVLGASKIVVEATKQGEEQAGAEGSVYDDYGDYIAMDSHYCEFNIGLTNAERARLKYRIYSPYNGYTHTFLSENYKADWENNQLYNWVKIKPTTARDVLARYMADSLDNNFMSLQDLLDPVNHPWGNWTITNGVLSTSGDDTDTTSTTVHYYTVFVDEYVYHRGDGRSVSADECEANGVESLWYTYVNQDDRVVELFDNTNRSADDESDYTFCKYTFAQKSIQTFYKHEGDEQHVLGVEHTDENYGLNYRWKYLTYNGGNMYNTDSERDTMSNENGRWNNLFYLDVRQQRGTPMLWDNYVNWTTPDSIKAGYSSGRRVAHEAAMHPVSQLGDMLSGTGSSDDATPGDPLHYANAACMNRNRDLDGNGRITPDEVRWYLPTSTAYIQIGIGQTELPDPLIKLLEHSPSEFDINDDRTEVLGKVGYHFITSNNQYVWAEELISVGDRVQGYVSKQWSYSVRCVRNLGTDPRIEPVKDQLELDNAFTHDAENHIIYLDRYTDISLRGYTSGYILPHDIGSEESRPYKAFQYAKSYCSNMPSDGYCKVSGNTVQFENASDEGTKSYRWYQSCMKNGICGQYTEEAGEADLGTWRVPTFREMALMYSAGLTQQDYDMLSCSRNHFVMSPWVDGYTADGWQYEFLGYNGYYNRKVLAKDVMKERSGSIHVRCVRDVLQ